MAVELCLRQKGPNVALVVKSVTPKQGTTMETIGRRKLDVSCNSTQDVFLVLAWYTPVQVFADLGDCSEAGQ